MLLQDDNMADIMLAQMILPLQYGFVPLKWANTLQMMLPKDPGIPNRTAKRKRWLLSSIVRTGPDG